MFDPEAFKDSDFVEVRAFDSDGLRRCAGSYPKGPNPVAYDVDPGETGVAPWGLVKRWCARKLCELLSEEPVEMPESEPPLAGPADLSVVRAGLARVPETDVSEAAKTDDELVLEVGELVMWNVDGEAQWPRRKRIDRIEETDGDPIAYFDGIDDGAPITELER